MKKFFAMFFASLLLCSCNTGQGNSEAPEVSGWRSAGLMPNRDSLNRWGNGYMAIAHSGKYIFVKDGKVANPQTLEADNRIFMSMQGSDSWEEISLPNKSRPFDIYGDESGFYVGTQDSGQVWHYEPGTKNWTNLYSMQVPENPKFNVYGMTKFEGRLLVSIGGSSDTASLSWASVQNLYMQPDGTWKDISPPNALEFYCYADDELFRVPMYFTQAREWRGKLFVMSAECGLWAYDGSQWARLPYPEGKTYDSPRAIAVHKDRLYTGQRSYGGVHEVQDDYSRVRVDSNTATDSSYYYNTPKQIKTLVSTGEYLLIAGIGVGMPKVYMGDKGDIKGWRYLSLGWCDDFRCIATETYGLDVVGDTLYAATWSGVFKFPLSDLEKSIEKEESYRDFIE